MTEQQPPSIVQFDAGPVKVGDGAPYVPVLGETIFEATGHVRLVRIDQGPIVLQVEPEGPQPATESLLQSHTVRFGSADDEPGSGGAGGGVMFQNNFGDGAKVGNWVTGQTINIANLD